MIPLKMVISGIDKLFQKLCMHWLDKVLYVLGAKKPPVLVRTVESTAAMSYSIYIYQYDL